MLSLRLSFAFLLLASVLALPANVEETSKDIDFHAFPEFAGLESLAQLGETDSEDADGDGDIEARAANQCTLKTLKEIMFDYTITEFESARNAKNPSCFDWRSNKCTLSPDRPLGFNFIPPCHRHDFGDTNFEAKKQWNPVNKARTDWRFRTDMLDVCATYKGWKNLAKRALCTVVANDYANAAVLFNPATDL